MSPYLTLLEASSFDAGTSLELIKTVITWILDVVKSEPILAGAFVVGVLVPAGFAIVGRIKNISN